MKRRPVVASRSRFFAAIRVLLPALLVVGVPAMAPLDMARAETRPARALKGVQRELDARRQRQADLDRKSQALSREIDRLSRQTVHAAQRIQGREARVATLAARLRRLDAETAAKRAALIREEQHLGATLAVLERMALHPSAILAAAPRAPNDMVRRAIILRDLVPRLAARARALDDRLIKLASLRAATDGERRRLGTTTAALDRARAALEDLIATRRRLMARTDAQRRREAARSHALARRASSLRELIARIDARARKRRARVAATRRPRAEPRAATASGAARLPVRGRIVRRFGQTDDMGQPSQGIVIRTRAGAQVVAPYAGKVVFAGPFRGYGRILIIEHGGGYHTLLAGFSRIDSTLDQRVLAGEPVGIMGAPATGTPSLYVELRKNGRPINPLPWLAARK